VSRLGSDAIEDFVIGELFVRFLLGGAVVAAFAALGEVCQPKTFAGLFGAAPSVAITTLALALGKQGPAYAAAEARSMVLGSAGLLVYSAACAGLVRRREIPVWLGAVAAWGLWLVVALGLFAMMGGAGAGGGYGGGR
jgi:hypothetical protein